MATEKYNLITYEPNSTDEFGNLIINVMSGSNSNMTKIDTALGDKPDKVVPATNGSIAILDAEGNLVDSEKTVDKIQPSTNEIMADISINDGDYVPLYDTGTSVHKKSLWSNIIAKIRTALFDTSNGLIKANGSGIISSAIAGEDYAQAIHGHSADDITDGVTNKVYTAEEKEKLAEIGVVPYYGTCTNSAGTAAKTTTITGFAAAQLEAGAVVWVKFTNTNTNTSATLNVSSTGAKPIRANGITPLSEQIAAGMDAIFQYDGAYWNHLNPIPVDRLALSGGTMTGSMAMGNNKITGLGTPTASADAVNKSYVDNLVGDIETLLTAI